MVNIKKTPPRDPACIEVWFKLAEVSPLFLSTQNPFTFIDANSEIFGDSLSVLRIKLSNRPKRDRRLHMGGAL